MGFNSVFKGLMKFGCDFECVMWCSQLGAECAVQLSGKVSDSVLTGRFCKGLDKKKSCINTV